LQKEKPLNDASVVLLDTATESWVTLLVALSSLSTAGQLNNMCEGAPVPWQALAVAGQHLPAERPSS